MLITVNPAPNITTGEAAAALDVDRTTLVRWMRAGIVTPASKTAGGHYRWNLDQLRQQLAEHEAERSGREPS